MENNNKPIDIILASPLENIQQSMTNMSLGELKGFLNVFKMMYQTQEAIKDKLIDRVDKGELDVNDPEVKETLDGIYGMMLKIESIVLVGEGVEKGKALKSE